ncbi:MAG: bifunctional metallophosphatase/5'-nucleotidase [Methanotrichaceae archaeon]|nr:bifunctional metallophosphatase/5'-nucleotidase [Methanotrichaceae archaeon]
MRKCEHLTVLQTNDTHAYFESHPELFWSGGHPEFRAAGGYARIASLINQAREEQPGRVLALDCGDAIHGTYAAVKTRGEAVVRILNLLGLDAMTGHWEFAYGPSHLQSLVREMDHPFLAANCYHFKSGEPAFPSFTIREAGGMQIGIVGIAATIVDKVMPGSFSRNLRFTLGREELEKAVDTLRGKERVDLVVVISHLGFPQDYRMASEVKGIDLILSAHTHNRIYSPVSVNGTIIVQSGCHGSFLGRLDLEVENGKVKEFRHRLITVDTSIEADPEVEEAVARTLDPCREGLGETLGKTATDLHRYTVLESTMDNFLLQGIIDATGDEIAFSNGWRYGAPVPSGPVVLNDLYNMIPMNPLISTVTLLGREIWAMMEENLELTFSAEAYRQMGGYVKRCLGLYVYFKLENPPGQRIQEMFVGGKRLEPRKEYRAAFVTSQGVPEKYGRSREELEIRAVDALRSYLARGPVRSGLRGTVTAV